MKCTNCGAENAPPGVFCTGCGTKLSPAMPSAPGSPPQANASTSPPPYGTPPYAPSPGLFDRSRPAIIREVFLGDVLYLIAGALLIGVGFENLGWIAGGFAPGLFVLLGLIAIPMGLIFMAHVILPKLLAPLEKTLDMLLFLMSLIFLLWGLLGSFSGNIAAMGGFLFAAGLFGLAGVGLRLGVLK